VIDYLSRGRLGIPRRVANVPMDPQWELLRQWQSQRLAHTYSDLLTSSHYGPACRFFLSDLYGPYDFGQRDQDIRQVQHSMRRFLPARILHSLNLVIELQDLTLSLDQTLLQVLVDELGMTDAITTELYAEGYRRGRARGRPISSYALHRRNFADGWSPSSLGRVVEAARFP
jgi:hypothetical protein